MVSGLALGGCSKSYDLGSESPEEVSFTEDAPSWDNGIGTLITKKCANCHTSVSLRSRFVPTNTPSTINGISDSSFFDDTTSAGLAYDRIYATTANPMPPTFATPLTTNEMAKLKTWLETKTIAISSVCGTTGSSALSFADVSATFTNDCGSCHNGGNRVAFDSLSKTKQYRRTLLTYLNNGTMPPSNSAYKSGVAGAALFNWLCFGADVQ